MGPPGGSYFRSCQAAPVVDLVSAAARRPALVAPSRFRAGLLDQCLILGIAPLEH